MSRKKTLRLENNNAKPMPYSASIPIAAGSANAFVPAGLNAFALPAAIGMLALYGIGFALLFSSLNVFFRDISHLSSTLLRLVFYLTPIVYPASLLGDRARWLALNPFYYPLEAVRHCIYYGDPAAP